MNNGFWILEAVGEISDRYVLEADAALDGLRQFRSRRRAVRTLLLAAALVLLFAATAYATGLFGLSARLAPLSAGTNGVERSVLIPNGLEGSATYKGSAAWWRYLDDYQRQHPRYPSDYSLDFVDGDEAQRSTCVLYRAYEPEVLDKLQSIARENGLKLYRDSAAATEEQRFYELSGVEPWGDALEKEFYSAYVFEDGSFRCEGALQWEGERLLYSLHRVRSGSLYPYGRFLPTDAERTEWRYTTTAGEELDLVLSGDSQMAFYVSPDGESFVELELQLPQSGEQSQVEALMEQIDFVAIARGSGEAGTLSRTQRGAKDNADALAVLTAFADSPVYRAGKEFGAFYTRTFYGASFTGVHGQAGYADIDAELERLSRDYGLTYASGKSRGNGLYGDAEVYSNGAWYAAGTLGEGPNAVSYQLHVIPRTALYTRLAFFPDFTDYARVWDYETAAGDRVILATHGPEKESLPLLYYETEESYVLVIPNFMDPDHLEHLAEALDWRELA